MKKIMLTAADLELLKNKVAQELKCKKGLPEEISISVNPSVVLTEKEKAEVCFENKAIKKMKTLIDFCDQEIGWYGIVERENEKCFIVKDILMFPQRVTSATVQTDDENFVAWENELTDEEFNKKAFYGHSHVNMGVSPSSTDLDFQNNLLQNIADFYVFGIFNKKGDHWFNIYDIKNNVLYENMDIKYCYYLSEEETWAKTTIEKYVKLSKPEIIPYHQINNYYDTYSKEDSQFERTLRRGWEWDTDY